MKTTRILFSRFIAFALGGQDMNQCRTLNGIPDRFKGVYQVSQVMAREWPDIIKFECLKEHARGEKALEAFLAFLEHRQDVFSDIG